jgi:hypothetical protein
MAKKLDINEYMVRLADKMAEQGEDDNSEDGEQEKGKIWWILHLYNTGYERKDIVKAGFNRSTVYRQCGEFDKLRKGHVREMYGLKLYEARIEMVMSRKKVGREEAIQIIAAKDLEG